MREWSCDIDLQDLFTISGGICNIGIVVSVNHKLHTPRRDPTEPEPESYLSRTVIPRACQKQNREPRHIFLQLRFFLVMEGLRGGDRVPCPGI